jgi:hypothetical protein
MARFRGLTSQQSIQQQAGGQQGVEPESHQWTPEQIQRWQLQQAQHQQYQPPGPPGYQDSPESAQGFATGQPDGWHGQPPYAGQAQAAGYDEPVPAHHQGHPPQFGSAQPRHQDAWSDLQRSARDSLAHRLSAPAHSEPPRYDAQGNDPRGYNGQPFADGAHAGPLSQDPRYRDSQGWDVGSYAPPHQHGSDPNASHGGAYDPADPRWAHHQGYEAPPSFAAQHAQPGYPEQAAGQGGLTRGQQYGFDAQQQHLQGQHPDQLAEYDDHAVEEVQERSRGPRTLVVAGALVGAILLGGGMAFIYKKVATTADSGNPPIVKAEKTPAKAKPANPGGKEVAHTDKRFLNSLGSAQPGTEQTATPPPGTSASAEGEGGPRRVTTLVVGRDGSLAAEPPVAAVPPPVSAGVPGMVIDGGPRPVLRGPAPAETASAPPPPLAPRTADVVVPRPRSEPPIPAPSLDIEQRSEPAPVVRTPPKKKAAVRDDAAAPPATTASAPVVRSSGSGFVTVLSSRKSREEAFSMYPDLQVKYADILQGMTPDVRAADLSAQGKGVVYRLVVGPPGSREAAIATCNKLKAQGFSGCWATPY